MKCNLPIDVNLIIYISYVIDFFFYNLVSIRVQVALNISLHKFIYFISNFFFVTIYFFLIELYQLIQYSLNNIQRTTRVKGGREVK